MRTDLAEIRRDAVRLLRQHSRAPESERTPLIRQLADTLVEGRGLFTREDGAPDWAGRTYTYRQWVGDIYAEADIRGEERRTVQSKTRYHLGAALRDALDEKTIRDYGLSPETPKMRGMARRKKDVRILRAIQARDVAGGSLMAITAAHTMLTKVDPTELSTLDERSAETAREILTDIEHAVRRLTKAAATGRPVAPLEFKPPTEVTASPE